MELKRMNAKDREALINLCAVDCLMQCDAEQFKLISKRIPNGWRDYRMMQSTIGRMTTNLLATVPPDQLGTILRHTENVTVRVVMKGINDKPKDDWVVGRADLALLINAAIEGQCLMCTNTTGQGCWLRRLIDESPVDVTGFDVGCMM